MSNTKDSSNPFDFDVDFEKVKSRRDKALAQKAAAQKEKQLAAAARQGSLHIGEDGTTRLLSGIDTTDGVSPANSGGGGLGGGTGTHGGLNTSASGGQLGSSAASGLTVGTGPGGVGGVGVGGKGGKGQQGFKMGMKWLRAGGVGPYDDEEKEQQEILYGGRRVTQWPYDEFHLVQQKYYTKLEELSMPPELKSNATSPAASSTTSSSGWNFAGITNKAGAGSPSKSSDALSPTSAASSTLPVFRRPADPPDIPTAVMGLGLVDFESKAEERAIAIVSTWLFDAGLIDELLVHGGMSSSSAGRFLSGKKGSSADSTSTPGGTSGADGTSAGGDSDDIVDVSSIPSAQGIEIGAHGFPLEGISKMDKEISKLRTSTQRQLALINARLNDGVAASGGEVQELVNAVTATKDDLGRLRELSTYIANSGDVNASGKKLGSPNGGVGGAGIGRSSKFMLTRYPKLKKAINARRNLARCFRELDFYSHIPVTCDRLREELHSGEWTEHEWTTLRNVSREHVELEIFLVEAEAGMKRRIDEENAERRQQESGVMRTAHSQTTSSRFASRQTNFASGGLPHNYEEVDMFLAEHVKNVWELGDEIRLRISSGIGAAFDLAMNNPAGMVALVEAVEVYETASAEYKTVHGEEAGSSNKSLRFTDMRAAALKQIYQDFELRGLEVFREVHMNAERNADDEEDTTNSHFSAVLRAANGLTSEIGFVQNQMAPCFPSHWALEMLWSTCVAHVCSKQILEQIGGTEGHKLPDLTVTQLLDLVAWVENFRETIEESFPSIGEHVCKKTYFNERPELLMENNKQVNMDVAKDSLAWANNMLWEVHDLAKDEFLFRTKEQTDEWLDNVYEADHTKNQTAEGRLITSLCEDVYSLAGVQLRTIRERLTRRSEALVQAVGVILKNLYEKQIASRNNFLLDLETCCASANDFIRMSEKCEELLGEMQAECNLSAVATEALEEQSAILLGLYSSDAVYAAQKVHIFIFEPIEEAIGDELFGDEWLNHLTHNELALTLVRTLEDFMGDIELFLDELMVGKAVDALVTATVVFYIRTLLQKSAEHKDKKKSLWGDCRLALTRMMGDIKTMKEYFVSLAKTNYPSLKRVVDNEFEILETIYELLSIAAGISTSNQRDFILFLQKRVKNIEISKFVVGDIWHLVKPTEEQKIYELVDSMEEELRAVAPTDESAIQSAADRTTVPGLRIDQVMAQTIDTHKRTNRPLKKNAVEQSEAMFKRWRETWDAATSG